MLLARLECEQGGVSSARIQPGFNHRSAEKLFEVRDYRQVLMLADRHDWQSPFTGELGIALTCEHLMGLVPPVRATWLRTLLAEQARIASHLAHLSFVPHRLADDELARSIRGLREQGRQLVLHISGNRVHPMLNRLGGLSVDATRHSIERLSDWAQECADCMETLAARLTSASLGAGIAFLREDQINAFGLSGPVARASGLERDLRIISPYLAYEELSAELMTTDVPDSRSGDALARFLQLALEIIQSHAIIQHCADTLAELSGPVDTPLSKIIKLPESEAFLSIQAPWGMAGFLVVSRAERTPWRLKLRTPSFANVQALEAALIGCPTDCLDIAFASLGWTAGDLDK
ncbi:NADH-quinone oxidoreductase subunit D [Luteococcus sp. Sow4_B9]|uniref:NADH-quinone oxidoreductase subunit D-related protein n=1 Tax=Luteococcus sp. Sow4_B9 TaxID=3438792 RepID=UPI003F99D8E5